MCPRLRAWVLGAYSLAGPRLQPLCTACVRTRGRLDRARLLGSRAPARSRLALRPPGLVRRLAGAR
eukprot:15355093-Alexandrium_andersonii.AAC.1